MPTKKTKSPDLQDIRVGDHTYFFSEVAQRRLISSSVTIFLFMLLLFVPFLMQPHAKALSLTWDGGGADNNWSTCANWSSDTCPGSGDALTFNSTSTKDSVVDAGFGGVVTSINITTGYSGTVSLSRSLQTSSTFTQSTGTFNGGSQTLDVDGAFSLTGGTFTASSGTMTFASTFTISGSPTFNHNSGTITFDGTTSVGLSCNNVTFNLVNLSHSVATKTVGLNCSLPLGNNPTVTGATTLDGTLSGTGTLTANSNLTMNSTAALSGFSGLSVTGTFNIISATANFSSYTTFVMNGPFVVDTSANITLPSNADFNSSFILNSSSVMNMPNGTVYMAAGVTISAGTTFNANSGTVVFDGTTSGTLTCNGATFNLVQFTNSGGAVKTVSSSCTFPLGANPTNVGAISLSGTLTGSGTMSALLGGTMTINSGGALSGFSGLVAEALTITGATVDFSSYTTFSTRLAYLVQTSANVTLPSNADINGTFTLSTSSTLNMPNGSVYFASTFTLNSGTTFNANSGTVVFDGTGGGTITCASKTFNSVLFSHATSAKTVASDCTLPLGSSPTVPTGMTLNGTLSGTGTLTFSAGTLSITSTGVLSGFNGLSVVGLTITGGTQNFSSYTTFVAGGTTTFQTSAIVTLPSGSDINGAFALNSSSTLNMPNGSVSFASTFTLSSGTTFNANSGTVIIDGTASAVVTCNSATFNLVQFNHSSGGIKTVSSGCTLPLGSDPSIPDRITLSGTLSGSGTLNFSGTSSYTLSTGGVLSGFTGLIVAGSLTVAGATADFGSYTTLDINTSLIMSSGSFTAPSGTMTLARALTFSGGTFNANSGTVVFDGATSDTLSCNSATFNLVTFAHTAGTKTVSSNCTLPLGSNPTIPSSITLNGTLAGTGTLTVTGSSFGYNSTAVFSGFSGLTTVNLTLTTATLNLSSYNPVTIGGNLSVGSGSSLTGPTVGMTVTAGFNIASGGTFNANGGTLTLGGTSRPGTTCDGTLILTKVVIANTEGARSVEASCTLPLGDNPTIGAGGDLTLEGTLTGSGKISAPSGTTVFLMPRGNITGFSNGEFGNLRVSNIYDASSYTTLNILNDLYIIQPGELKAPSGTLYVAGNLYKGSNNGFLRLNDNSGERAYITDTAATSVSGDIDIRVLTALDNWKYGQNLIGKYLSTGNNRCYQFTVNTATGFLGFGGSTSGTATNYSAISTAAPSVSNFNALWVRVTRNVTTGDVKFYTSSNGSSWSQLGDTVSTTAGTLHDCAADLDIGSNANGTGSNSAGNYYRVQIRDNILDNGSGIVFDADFTSHSAGTTSFNESSSNAATVQIGTGAYLYGSGSGSYTNSNGTVNLSGGDQEIQGDWTFYNLTKEVTTAATLTMPAGNTITINGHLRLKGKGSQYLYLVSSSPGTQWLINRRGTSYMSKLAVKDSRHINNTLVACHSIDNGNNYRWAFNTDVCYSSLSSEVTSTGDNEVVPAVSEVSASQSDNKQVAIVKTSGSTARKYIVGGSLLVAIGGIWWLLALLKRRHNEPVQWQ